LVIFYIKDYRTKKMTDGCWTPANITLYYIIVLIGIFAVIMSITYPQTLKNPQPAGGGGVVITDEFTTFEGSDYSILIQGELTKTHVEEAEGVLGTITGVQIGTAVTSIGNSTDNIATAPFYQQTGLTSLEFKGTSTCTEIGSLAFSGCTALENFELPATIDTLNSQCFEEVAITEFTVPDLVSELPSSCFINCTSLTTVTYSSETNLTTIGASCYSGCTTLTTNTVPSGITTIGATSFNGCTLLSSFTLPATTTTLGTGTFNGCTSLSSLTLTSGIGITTFPSQFLRDCAFTSFEIPNYITELGSNSFESNPLTSLTFAASSSLTTIGANAFEDIIGLTTVTFPSTITDIEGGAFEENTGFTSVTFDGTGVSRSVNVASTAFSSPLSLESLSSGGTITVPAAGVTYDADDSTTFVGSGGSTTIFVNGALTAAIVATAKTTTTNITSVTGGIYITSLGDSAFEGEAITSYTYKDEANTSCDTIGNSVFKDCTSLSTMTILDSTTSIGTETFENTALITVTLPNTLTTISNELFNSVSTLTMITFGNAVTSVGISSFQNCTSLGGVSFPTTVTSLGEKAFSGCTSLVSSDPFPANVETVGIDCFSGCTSITAVVFPTSLTTFNQGCFLNCSNITSFSFETVPGFTTFPNFTFSDAGVTSATIPDEIITVGNFVLQNCPLTSVTIGTGVTSTGTSAFNYDSISTVTWEAGNARAVSIGATSFGSPASMAAFNNSTYNVPAGGEIFT
jgi:hypothetical protein